MIHVTRLNGHSFLLNAELIEQLDSTPDTVIVLTNGTSIVVRESADLVLERVLEYKRMVNGGLPAQRA